MKEKRNSIKPEVSLEGSPTHAKKELEVLPSLKFYSL